MTYHSGNFESPRFIYRLVRSEDLPLIFELYGDEKTTKHVRSGVTDLTTTQKKLEAMLAINQQKNSGYWMAFRKQDKKFAGMVNIKSLGRTRRKEIGFIVQRSFWGQGYATEMVKTLMIHARQTFRMNSFVALVMPENIPSKRVLEKTGFNNSGKRLFYGINYDYYISK